MFLMYKMNHLAKVVETQSPGSDFEYRPKRPRTVCKLWVDLKNAKQTTQTTAETQTVLYSHVAFSRYQPGITEEHELHIGTQVFGIDAVINVDERGEFLELHLVSQAND